LLRTQPGQFPLTFILLALYCGARWGSGRIHPVH
jgi:hypothetical protein